MHDPSSHSTTATKRPSPGQQHHQIQRSFAMFGTPAYRVARALTGNASLAEQVVVTAFCSVAARHDRQAPPTRAEVMEAIWHSVPRPQSPKTDNCDESDPLYEALTDRELDVVVLAAVGDCTCWEIATTIGMDRDDVHQTLRSALTTMAMNVDRHRLSRGARPSGPTS